MGTVFVDTVFFKGRFADKMEQEANNFALEILMPKELFREQVKCGNNKAQGLAEHFGVSCLNVRLRAKMLGMRGHGL
jgi:Zn-dependent peptidase ImmA (M78 family)